MIALDRPLVFFDIEATGTSPSDDRIVDICLLRREPDGAESCWSTLVNPGGPIPREASDIHHVTDAMVAGAPRFHEIGAKILAFIGDADIGGFGVGKYDVPLLQAELRRVGLELRLGGRRVVDALTIYHRMERRTLSAAYKFYCGKELPDAHRAEPDTRAAAEVFWAQLRRYSELPRGIEGLAAFCNARDPRHVDAEGKFVWRNGEAAFNFGKHRTVTLREVALREPGYLEWLMKDQRTTAELAKLCHDALGGKFPAKDPA